MGEDDSPVGPMMVTIVPFVMFLAKNPSGTLLLGQAAEYWFKPLSPSHKLSRTNHPPIISTVVNLDNEEI